MSPRAAGRAPHDADARRVTGPARLDAATFDVAGVACRVECAHAKPILWVNELHPGFRSTREPDVVVTFRYEDAYWARRFPWLGPDRLLDAPVYTEHSRGARLRSAYYDAEIDAARRHVLVRIAGGFGVGGMLRALYAILLPSRGACLVRASILPVADDAVLVCDDGNAVVALVDRGDGVEAEPTPFHDGVTLIHERGRRIVAVDFVRHARRIAAAELVSGPRVDVAAELVSRVITIDHSMQILERVLDVVTRLMAGVSVEVGAVGVAR